MGRGKYAKAKDVNKINQDESSFEENYSVITEKLDNLTDNQTKLTSDFDIKMEKLTENHTKISTDLEELKNVIIQNLVESNKKLQNTIKTLQNKVEKMEKREKEMSVQIEKQNQYGRRNNIEISGVMNEIKDEELEEKVIEILDKIDVKATKEDIEACHRLPPTKKNKIKKTIVRFVNRKKAEKCVKNKKNLENVNLKELKLNDNPLFISENLNEHYRQLSWMCRSLKREGLIFSYNYQNETFLVKAKENSDTKIKVSHKNDLLKYYSDFFNFED